MRECRSNVTGDWLARKVMGNSLVIGALKRRLVKSVEEPERFCSSPKCPVRLLGPNGYRCSFPGVKRPGREVNHLPPSSAEVKNVWSHTSTPPICLHGLDREKNLPLIFTKVGCGEVGEGQGCWSVVAMKQFVAMTQTHPFNVQVAPTIFLEMRVI
jgi:hypothetical protein